MAAQAAPAIVTTRTNVDDTAALEDFKQAKRECFADRWRFERLWTRNIHYINLRQWLGVYSRSNGWADANVPKRTPRPATSKPKEALQAIRSHFTSVRLGVDVQPTSRNAKSVITATTANRIAPLNHLAYGLDAVFQEGDFWFCVTGNVIYHTCYDENGTFVADPYELCAKCESEFTSSQIAQAHQACPTCGAPAAGNFSRATNPDGSPRVEHVPQGCGVTTALSPLEIAWPMNRPRWKDVDRIIRLRWRTKRYYEEHPELAQYVNQIRFAKSSTERSLQIFQSLPYQTELGTNAFGIGQTGSSEEEGIAEYELWERPTPKHPEGRVLRVAGDGQPIVLHLEDSEGLPGPLPYHDQQGRPLFPFRHAAYEHVGGRVVGSGFLDPAIPKIDSLNRLDSLVEMMMTRNAIPQMIKPKGQEIVWLGDSPAMPGLVAEYAPAPGGGKPEQWPGQEPPRAWDKLRAQFVEEIDAAFGLFDILKGAKPQGVEAYSAMQLLQEMGMARFASAFMNRATVYAEVQRDEIEIEREFGLNARIKAVMSPARSYAFETFMKADLDADVMFELSPGATQPKTHLAERANIEHYRQLGGMDMTSPETRYAVAQKLDLTDLEPGPDSQHQRALRNQQAFEEYVQAGKLSVLARGAAQNIPPEQIDPQYPFVLKRWYDPAIHRMELIRWAIDDQTVELLAAHPEAEPFIEAYLTQLEEKLSASMQPPTPPMKVSLALKGEDLVLIPEVDEVFRAQQQLPPPAPPLSNPHPAQGPQGAGRAMANSQQNSAPVGNTPQPGSPAIVTH